MTLPLFRWAAATAALLCLAACSREPNACEFTQAISPLAVSAQTPARQDQPRGEDVRLVWVDAAGRTVGVYSTYTTLSYENSDPASPYHYDYYNNPEGHYLDSEGRKWQVSAEGIRPYPVTIVFGSGDCSGPGLIYGYVKSTGLLARRYFAIEGTVVSTIGGRTVYVPLPGTGGPECTPVRRRSYLDGTTGECVPIMSVWPEECSYALDALPEAPPHPQTCPTATPLHLEARALPENERRPCDKYLKRDAAVSVCRASRPGTGYLPEYSTYFLKEFYVDDAHYVWRLYSGELVGVAPTNWYYFTDSSCQGEKYVDVPLDPHQTVGLIGRDSIGPGRQVGPAYARPRSLVPTKPQPLEARARAEVDAYSGMGPCETLEPTTMNTLIPFSQLITVSTPVLPPFP